MNEYGELQDYAAHSDTFCRGIVKLALKMLKDDEFRAGFEKWKREQDAKKEVNG